MAVNNQAYSFLEALRKNHQHASTNQTARLLFHEFCTDWNLNPKTFGLSYFSKSDQAEKLCENRSHAISEPLLTEVFNILKLKTTVDELSQKTNIPIRRIIETKIPEQPFNGGTIRSKLNDSSVKPIAIRQYLNMSSEIT